MFPLSAIWHLTLDSSRAIWHISGLVYLCLWHLSEGLHTFVSDTPTQYISFSLKLALFIYQLHTILTPTFERHCHPFPQNPDSRSWYQLSILIHSSADPSVPLFKNFQKFHPNPHVQSIEFNCFQTRFIGTMHALGRFNASAAHPKILF